MAADSAPRTDALDRQPPERRSPGPRQYNGIEYAALPAIRIQAEPADDEPQTAAFAPPELCEFEQRHVVELDSTERVSAEAVDDVAERA